MSRRSITRRRLLLDAGSVTVGAIVLGVAACSSEDAPPADPTTSGGSEPPGATTTPSSRPSPTPAATEASAPTETGWARVDLGFVSAYVLVRGGEAVLVDTGIGGSADAIAGVLEASGARWADLSDVILTHRHPDHAGSIGEVAEAAPDAAIWVGTGDLDAVAGIVDATGVDDGATVAGLRIVGTPGHTPGHIAVHDPDLGVLLTGDAINGTDAGEEVTGPNERFTSDMEAAIASVRVLAGLPYDVVLFGHGEPVTEGGTAAVTALADSLGA